VRSLIVSLNCAGILSQLFTMYFFFSANHFAALHQWDHEPHRGSSVQLFSPSFELVARAQARLCPGAVCICSSYVIHVIINVIVSTVYIYVYIYIYQQITCITVCMQIDIEYKLKKKLVNLTQNN
jgi:hypothetical protein